MHEGEEVEALFRVSKLVAGLFLGTLSQRFCIDQILGDPTCLLPAGGS